MVYGLNGLTGACVKHLEWTGAHTRERGSVLHPAHHVGELTVLNLRQTDRHKHVLRMEAGVTGLHGVDVAWGMEEVKREQDPVIIHLLVVEELTVWVQMRRRGAVHWTVDGQTGLLLVSVTRPQEHRYLTVSQIPLHHPAMESSVMGPALM